jgi:hypothetical protein
LIHSNQTCSGTVLRQTEHTYDKQGQLTSETYGGTTYTYDTCNGVCDFKGVIQMKRNGVKFIVRKKNDITAAIIFFLIAWLGAILICLFTKTGGWVTLAIILALQLFCLPYLIYSATWKLEICANSFRTTCFFREKEYAYSQIKRVLLRNEFREGVTLWLFLQDGKMIKVAEDYKNFNRFHRFIQSKRSIECER